MKTLGRISVFGLGLVGCAVLLTGCPCDNKVEVQNDTFVPVTEVYVKYRLSDDWGENRISGNISPGETENIGNLVPGRYDVLMVYIGGAEETDEVDVLCSETYTVEADGE